MLKSQSDFWDLLSSSDNTEEIIKQLYQLPTWFSYVNDRLTYREYVPQNNIDEDINYLIECYVNKKSKRVRYAGVKLRKVFLELPPIEQREVGLALLTGSKADTEWVCQRLDNYKPSWDKDWVINWHPCYSKGVEEAWVKYKGKFCGRLLIQFLDKETVRKYLNELLEEDELYFGLCRRFVHEDWFALDRGRLAKSTSINAYLSILSQTSDGITDEEATCLLYKWIGTIGAKIKEEYSVFKRENIFWRYRLEEHRVIYAWGIDTAIYYLLKMGKHSVIAEFLKWDHLVYHTYYSRLTTENDCPENQESFVDVILEKFPSQYRKYCLLNSEFYEYAYSAGQPFTAPRRKPWHFDKMYDIPMCLEESKEEKSTNENGIHPEDNNISTRLGPFSSEEDIRRLAPYTNEEDLKQLVESCPQLQSLIDSLELQPINSTAEQHIGECPF